VRSPEARDVTSVAYAGELRLTPVEAALHREEQEHTERDREHRNERPRCRVRQHAARGRQQAGWLLCRRGLRPPREARQVGEGGEVVGVVSARDLGGRDRDEVRRMRPIGAMMTAYAVKATPDMPVRQAANVMRGWNIGCLPVIEPDGTLAGIVTVSDLLRLLAEQVPSPAKLARMAKPAARKAAGKKVVKIGKAAKTRAAKKSRPARA